jgi:ABC-type protease/lipase transport system fused ATPase/permease subunit
MNLELDVRRALEAKGIIENPMVIEAIGLIRANVTAKWEASKSSDKEGREQAWMMLKAVNEFQRFFEHALQTGKVAEHELSLLEKAQEKVRKLWR